MSIINDPYQPSTSAYSEVLASERRDEARSASNGRFYVWQEGWVVRSAWRTVPPDRPGLIDCTDMGDDEFEAMMCELQELEHANTAPGHPGDPGLF